MESGKWKMENLLTTTLKGNAISEETGSCFPRVILLVSYPAG